MPISKNSIPLPLLQVGDDCMVFHQQVIGNHEFMNAGRKSRGLFCRESWGEEGGLEEGSQVRGKTFCPKAIFTGP